MLKYHLGLSFEEVEPMTPHERDWWMIRIGKQKETEIAAMKKKGK